MFIYVMGWAYQMSRLEDGRFQVVHIATPSDGGYGCNSCGHFAADYFRTHTLADFYGDVSGMQMIPDIKFINIPKEMEDLRKSLEQEGWLEREG